MPPVPLTDYKKKIMILLAAAALAAFGFWYYKFVPTVSQQPLAAPSPSPFFTPLPEPKEIYFIQGEITQVIGKTLMVKVNKLVGQDFASSKLISEEYKVSVGDKTELLNTEGGAQKPAKAIFKDFKKGNAVSVYTDKNTAVLKEFTATKIELLSRE